MTPSRTVIVGSALPLLILIGLVGFPPARVAIGLEGPTVPLESNAIPIADRGSAAGLGRAPTPDEALSLVRLRRSITAGRRLAFTGTEIVSAWHLGRPATRVLELVQGADGVRTIKARNVGDVVESQAIGSGTADDALSTLSDRALDALAAGYELRIGPADQVAGRAATVVVAARNGREVARIWLDDQTGLLLRQDVLDGAGRLRRMAAFVELTMTDPVAATPSGPRRFPIQSFGVGGLALPAARRSGENRASVTPTPTPTPAPAGPWSDVVSPDELTALRADGWPCLAALPAGYVLLDARQLTAAGHSTLHLTYGDGLSAISVFLQRGELDVAGLPGLTKRKWGDTEVYVRDGWPDVMVWQGGQTVITAVGDADQSELQAILSALPRQANHGRLDSLQQRMGSALAWFRG